VKRKLGFKFAVFALLLTLGVGGAVIPLNAQYFGRNKVQYKNFDFKVMHTEHFDIYFYPEKREAALQAARIAERWYARLSRIFNHQLKGRQPLILYASATEFQQTSAIPGILGEGTGGVTEILKRRIVLPLGVSLAESDHVIGHELVHAFQFDLASEYSPKYAGASTTVFRIPLWLIEGLAEYLSIGPVDPHTAMWMRDATQKDNLPTSRQLNTYRYFPYRYGHSLWAYITGKWGDGAVPRLMKSFSRTGEYEGAIRRLLGVSLEELIQEWQESLKDTYSPLAEMTQITDPSSRLLIQGTEEKRLNVSPSLSPDGHQIVFLSSRDLFSVDMYLAETETGRIKRRLIKTAVDPHFESLEFIKSSGCWDAEGERFLFSAVSKGRPVLTLINVKKRMTEKEVAFPELGEILTPTWSPDGRFVAFSALAGGFTDIFVYDLGTEMLQKLTDDPYADLYPTWSPDGQTIAFVTDRFSTDFSILSTGNYDLALLDPETGDIQKVPVFNGAKNINPQWTPDSKSLYFLSDPGGITNIYRIDVDSQEIFQITNLYTGVSGILPISPALSVSQKSGRLVYCVFENNYFNIYSIDAKESLAGSEPQNQFGHIQPSVLPPREEPEGEVLELLQNPLFGLPEAPAYPIADYKPKLQLDYISQPQMAIGVDRFGTYAGGGAALFFSDMLGYHSLAGMFQVSNRLQDTAALVGYQNSSHRLNWGGVVQRIPYISGGYILREDVMYGEPVLVEEEIIFRQIFYQASGFAAYPFNRSQRVELSGGYRLIDYQQEVYTRVFSLVDGFEIYRQREKLPAPETLQFGFASLAFVYDTAYFGATSPILGQSYRIQFESLNGTIDLYTVLADFRHYFMPAKPFTMAFRLLHYGRYGGGAEDPRFYPIFLGYETLVRGYSSTSFSSREIYSPTNPFDYGQLFGSKILVANVELRFPLFQILGLGKGYYGIFPIDFISFFDAGVAWMEGDYDSDGVDDRAWFLGGERKFVRSVGVGLRTNLFGFMILGLNYVRPLDRPHKDWYFQFTLTPGF